MEEGIFLQFTYFRKKHSAQVFHCNLRSLYTLMHYRLNTQFILNKLLSFDNNLICSQFADSSKYT